MKLSLIKFNNQLHYMFHFFTPLQRSVLPLEILLQQVKLMTNRWGDVYTASNAEARLLLWDGTLLFPNKIMQLRPEWPWIFRSMCTYLHPYHIYLHVSYISSLSLPHISSCFLYITCQNLDKSIITKPKGRKESLFN